MYKTIVSLPTAINMSKKYPLYGGFGANASGSPWLRPCPIRLLLCYAKERLDLTEGNLYCSFWRAVGGDNSDRD